LRPAKVKVLGKTYSIDFVPAEHSGLTLDGEQVTGLCDTDKQTIHIQDGMHVESEQDTLLHEVMHAIERAMDLDVEDTIVYRLATGVIAVLKDNQSFVSYLRRRK
jgi:carbonic anhydrase